MSKSINTGSQDENSKHRMWDDKKAVDKMVIRLNRIEGQIRGIKRMIQEQVYCDDVLNQISSAQAALHGVSKLLLEKHIKGCVKEQIIEGDEQVFDEIVATIFRMIR